MSYDKNSIEFLPKPTVHNFVDIEGQKFNQLTVLGIIEKRPKKVVWLCECECGTLTPVLTSNLSNGHTQSCGCWKKELIRNRSITHGMRNTSEYRSYVHAKDRCNNPNDASYPDYGGRGIEFRFNSFEEFFDHMGYKPLPKLTLERIGNDGHYEKGNVKWATRREQNNNKRSTRWLTHQGRKQTLAQWCRELHLNRKTIWARLNNGWSDSDALTRPLTNSPHLL